MCGCKKCGAPCDCHDMYCEMHIVDALKKEEQEEKKQDVNSNSST
jgi:hypothetical protein